MSPASVVICLHRPAVVLDQSRVMSKRARVLAVVVAIALAGYLVFRHLSEFPPETTPEGAYMRIALSIANDDVVACFPYLDEEAQHAAFSIHDYAAKAAARIEASYPEEAKSRALPAYRALADARDGPGVWALLARRHGWSGRLRRDLSGAEAVEIADERATITTARGTRYSFRRRPNGIWGLTLFTAELSAEAERLARDWEQIDAAAADYQRESPN